MTVAAFSSGGEYEPVASGLIGLRVFAMTNGDNRHKQPGLLYSVFKTGHVWSPGVNTARCLNSYLKRLDVQPLTARYMKTRVPPHRDPVASCQCGFWAYTEGEHNLSVSDPIAVGIIAGWGPTVIGPSGFRAGKARILALTFPTVLPDRYAGEAPRLSGYARIQPGRDYGFDVRQRGGGGYHVITQPAADLAMVRRGANMAKDDSEFPPVDTDLNVETSFYPVSQEYVDLVKENYSGAQFFNNVRDMVSAYPLTSTASLMQQDEE